MNEFISVTFDFRLRDPNNTVCSKQLIFHYLIMHKSYSYQRNCNSIQTHTHTYTYKPTAPNTNTLTAK